MAISTFARKEIKFLLSKDQHDALLPIILEHMHPDEYCKDGKEYGIYNIYFDTADDYLIRTSLAKPYFKEKLRLRSYYSPALPENGVFLEIKRKIGGIVTKRRVHMTLEQAQVYLETGQRPPSRKYIYDQVFDELDVFLAHYHVEPKQYVSYQREAFFGKNDPDFRLTFDRHLIERRYDLSLAKSSYGNHIIDEDMRIMEVKIHNAIPLWLIRELSALKIYKTSISKYGKAYENYVKSNIEGEAKYG